MNNKYIKRSHISEAKFRDIVRYFSLDVNALKIESLTKLNRNTVNRYLCLIRERIVELCEQASPFQGEVEVDESYFGARRIKGNVEGEQQVKHLSSVSFSEVAKSIQRSYLIVQKRPYKPLSAEKLIRKV